jgi:Cu/Ag efflux pump CusA
MASYRIRVLGYSFSGVEQMAMDLKERLERIPRVRNVDISTAGGFQREKAIGVTIEPDRAALARFGLTSADLGAAITREIRGSVGAQLLEIGGDEIPVNGKALGANNRSLDELRALLPHPDGGGVPLEVSTVGQDSTAIDRETSSMRTVAYEFHGPNRLAGARRVHEVHRAAAGLRGRNRGSGSSGRTTARRDCGSYSASASCWSSCPWRSSSTRSGPRRSSSSACRSR